MADDRTYVAKNQAELERLRRLVDRLSDQELAKPMPAGWTVAGVLAHLAFWDYRVVVLLDEWGAEGRGTPPPAIEESSTGWINDAGKPLCLALPPRVAARMAVEAAVAADQRVAALSDSLLAANRSAGAPISVMRAEHRREHLDEIERALGAARA
ncbi:MAG TPA: maleylpyruvate isomerase N-terminal domain-containing protein [Candidatus Bathyarchaeia archaeon]|nr:maleylpyruvate isomerase N-terminal domain-containing protein [Candidatus Bathyarchaeia archaeon]